METIKKTFTDNHHELVRKAIIGATKGHNDSNHLYGDASYTIHLSLVVDVAYRFIHLIPIEKRAIIIAACWLHDSIEDARLSYNDVVKMTNIEVAEIVRAVTNYGRGRNREERMPDFVYQDIRDTQGATFVKLCDRIANMEFGGKTKMYGQENEHFKKQLYNHKWDEMFDYIEELISNIK